MNSCHVSSAVRPPLWVPPFWAPAQTPLSWSHCARVKFCRIISGTLSRFAPAFTLTHTRSWYSLPGMRPVKFWCTRRVPETTRFNDTAESPSYGSAVSWVIVPPAVLRSQSVRLNPLQLSNPPSTT